jgi:hypothetical protein
MSGVVDSTDATLVPDLELHWYHCQVSAGIEFDQDALEVPAELSPIPDVS